MISNFINKYSDLAAYNADETKQYPNVSYLETEDEVKWQATEPIDQEHVVAKYNVVDTSNPTRIIDYAAYIDYMIVDGVRQPSVSNNFTFSTTGEHKAKYKINSRWTSYSAFRSCYSLTSATIPDNVTGIGSETFANCTGLTSVHIPSGATSIDYNAFAYCTSLTSVTIPDGVTKIDNNAFDTCSGLTSVTIPDSVTDIRGNAFQNCSGLTTITIPDSVTSIGDSAFRKCKGLTSITVNAITPPTMGVQVFNNTNDCPIYVPSASVNAYKAAGGWSTYASRIQAIQ